MTYTSIFPLLLISMLIGIGQASDAQQAAKINKYPNGIHLEGDTLYAANQHIGAKYLWNGGQLILAELNDRGENRTIHFQATEPDLYLPGEADAPSEGLLIPNNSSNRYQEATVEYELGQLNIRCSIRIYEGASAIRHTFYVKGEAAADSWIPHHQANQSMIESDQISYQETARMGQLHFRTRHWNFSAVSFTEATDHHDSLVSKRDFLSYRNTTPVTGNVLQARHPDGDIALFILKESPISYSQQAYPGYDFTVRDNGISVHGWGDRSKDSRMNADFILISPKLFRNGSCS